MAAKHAFKELSSWIALKMLSGRGFRVDDCTHFCWFPFDCLLLEVMQNTDLVSIWTHCFNFGYLGLQTMANNLAITEKAMLTENSHLRASFALWAHFLQVCISFMGQTLTEPLLCFFLSLRPYFFPLCLSLSFLHFWYLLTSFISLLSFFFFYLLWTLK